MVEGLDSPPPFSILGVCVYACVCVMHVFALTLACMCICGVGGTVFIKGLDELGGAPQNNK